MIQAILTRNICSAWFAHPSFMGITRWNMADGGYWFGAFAVDDPKNELTLR